MHEGDNPAEDHVDGGSEQCRGNEEKGALNDIGAQRPVGGLVSGHGATDITDCFNYNSNVS